MVKIYTRFVGDTHELVVIDQAVDDRPNQTHQET